MTPLFIPWKRPVLSRSLGSAPGFSLNTSLAYHKHWPSLQVTTGLISLLAGMYPIHILHISTTFWPCRDILQGNSLIPPLPPLQKNTPQLSSFAGCIWEMSDHKPQYIESRRVVRELTIVNSTWTSSFNEQLSHSLYNVLNWIYKLWQTFSVYVVVSMLPSICYCEGG